MLSSGIAKSYLRPLPGTSYLLPDNARRLSFPDILVTRWSALHVSYPSDASSIIAIANAGSEVRGCELKVVEIPLVYSRICCR